MLKVGLTGGIAAGKSVVGEMLAALGAQVIQADDISHQLMQPGEPVYREVVARFGPGILHQDGSVNRARLAEFAFGPSGSGRHEPARVQVIGIVRDPGILGRGYEFGRESKLAHGLLVTYGIRERGSVLMLFRIVHPGRG